MSVLVPSSDLSKVETRRPTIVRSWSPAGCHQIIVGTFTSNKHRASLKSSVTRLVVSTACTCFYQRFHLFENLRNRIQSNFRLLLSLNGYVVEGGGRSSWTTSIFRWRPRSLRNNVLTIRWHFYITNRTRNDLVMLYLVEWYKIKKGLLQGFMYRVKKVPGRLNIFNKNLRLIGKRLIGNCVQA